MKYIFFDIECANCDGGNGKICSLGYVLTDESFNVIEYKDLLVNPKAKFKLRGYGNKSYIELAYEEAEFLAAPEFPYYYGKIKELLSGDDTLVFGYAPENDAGFLRSEFERYRLKEISFTFYDVQRLFKACMGDENVQLCSLSSACDTLGIDTAFKTHKSCDDAYATMLVMKELTRRKSASAQELVSVYPKIKGELKNGDITALYFRQREELKSGEENLMKGANKDDFRYLTRRLAQIPARKKICFSWLFEFGSYTEMVILVSELSKHGYRYTSKLSEADIFVKKPKKLRGVCKREKEITEARQKMANGEKSALKSTLRVIPFDEVLIMLGLSFDELKNRALGAKNYIKDLKNGAFIE